jgi:urease accessory protein
MQTMTFKQGLSAAVVGGLMLGLALPALAHPGHAPDGAGGGFAAGLLHPMSGLDHVLALLAVGLWSRQQRHGYVLPPAFLVLMALGASAGPLLTRLAHGLPALETSIAATVLLLGVLAACALRVAPALSVAAVGACGFLHGLAHGRELAGMDAVAAGTGFLVASALLMAAGALPGARLRRMAGAAIGAAGALLLAGLAGLA